MTVTDVTYFLFAAFNALRIVSYLPQIHRVARDTNGASAISYSTWGLWTAANATTGLYAAVNVHDLTLAALNLLNAVCCLAVIALTAVKRRHFTRTSQLPALETGPVCPHPGHQAVECGPSHKGFPGIFRIAGGR